MIQISNTLCADISKPEFVSLINKGYHEVKELLRLY